MKIMYFIDSLLTGGAETLCTKYLLALKKQGIESCVVVYKKRGTFLEKLLTEENIMIYQLFGDSNKLSLIRLIRKLPFVSCLYFRYRWKKIISDFNPTIIHVNTCLNYFYPNPKKVVTFFSFHTEIDRYFSIWKDNPNRFQKFVDNGMNFIAINLKFVEEIKTRFKTNNVSYVPNGVDISEIREKAYSKEKVLKMFNLPKDAFIVGHVGRFNPVKNHERLIEIFRDLRRINEKAYLLIVGTGSIDDIKRINKIVDDCGVTKYTVLTGLRNDATSLINAFDVLMLPSYSEGFSLVMIEGQILGKKCIASDAIPPEVVFNDNVYRIPLSKDNSEWIKYITNNMACGINPKIEDLDLKKSVDKLIFNYRKVCE